MILQATFCENGQLLSWGQTSCQLTGLTAQEVGTLKQMCAALFPDRVTRLSFKRWMQDIFDAPPAVFKTRCYDNEIKEFFWSLQRVQSPLTETQNELTEQIYFFSAVENNSDEDLDLTRAYAKQLERQVKRRTRVLHAQNSALIAVNESLDEFTYAVSHDLKAPIRTLIGFSRYLVDNFGDQLNDEAEVYLEMIDASAKQMGHRLESLLKLSRSAGRESGEKTWFETENAAVEAINTVLSNEQFRSLNPVIQIQDNLPRAWAVESQVVQVFENLITNALKYAQPTICPEIFIKGKNNENGAIFWVEDNGIGISEKMYQTIFQPFRRLNSDDTIQGSGIGLSICKKILQSHNGKIWAEANNNVAGENGTKFYFAFPWPANWENDPIKNLHSEQV